MKKWSLDSEKDTTEEIIKKLEDPKSIVQNLSIDMNNPDAADKPVTSGGWKNDLLNSYWQMAKRSNAHHTSVTLLEAKTAERWSCRITMWHPDYYKGWRKVIPKIVKWLENL